MDYGAWGILARAMVAQQPRTEVDVKAANRRVASDILVEPIRRIGNDFPDRPQACFRAGGEQFEYTM